MTPSRIAWAVLVIVVVLVALVGGLWSHGVFR